MSASLVGSEMCIRDSNRHSPSWGHKYRRPTPSALSIAEDDVAALSCGPALQTLHGQAPLFAQTR
eukprot:7765853-Alexandrium_andersonii.AAC.1